MRHHVLSSKPAMFWITLAAVGLLSNVTASAAGGNKPLKVCLLSGCMTYASEIFATVPGLPREELQRFLHAIECTQADDDLPGLDQLDDCDVAFIFIKRMKLKGEQLERFKKYVTSGRPIVWPCGPPAMPCRRGWSSITKCSEAITTAIIRPARR